MLVQRSWQIRNAYIPIDFLNKIVWLIIPLVLKYSNQQQVCMILIKLTLVSHYSKADRYLKITWYAVIR